METSVWYHSIFYPGVWVVWEHFHYSAVYPNNTGLDGIQPGGALMIPAAITTAIMMPLIGKTIVTRGIPQQYLVAEASTFFLTVFGPTKYLHQVQEQMHFSGCYCPWCRAWATIHPHHRAGVEYAQGPGNRAGGCFYGNDAPAWRIVWRSRHHYIYGQAKYGTSGSVSSDLDRNSACGSAESFYDAKRFYGQGNDSGHSVKQCL